jgi:hypothetical protein
MQSHPTLPELTPLPVSDGRFHQNSNDPSADGSNPLQVSLCPDKSGGLNGWTQHSVRTQLAVKTRLIPLARVRSAGTLPSLGFDRVRPNRCVLPGKHSRINALDGVASTG